MQGDLERVLAADAPQDVLARLLGDDDTEAALLDAAACVKEASFGNAVFVRCIIEFSNHCRCGCAYCGISRHVPGAVRYRMEPSEIVDTALAAAEYYGTIILQSGEDPFFTAEVLAGIVQAIHKNTNAVITLSAGEMDKETYQTLYDAGAARYLMKHETADSLLYEKYHDGPLASRLAAQDALREIGYELGSGFMVGLPGQTDETLAGDILLLKKQGVSMAGIGPFIAHGATALAGSADGSPRKTLRALALTRLVLPHCHLPSTTALNVKGGLRDALFCGANVVMQKATPAKYAKLYDLYPGRDQKDMPLRDLREDLDERLAQMGLRSI